MIRKFDEKITDSKINSPGGCTSPAAFYREHPTGGFCLIHNFQWYGMTGYLSDLCTLANPISGDNIYLNGGI
jgi:hypothetical protein